MLKIVRASVLLMALAVTASAGEMPNNVTGQPTPTTPVLLTQEPPAEAEADTDTLRETTADSFGETLLNLLDSVLALF